MTYAESANHNSQFGLKAIWKGRMQGDGSNLKWVKDPEGKIGYIGATRSDAFTIRYPVKVLKANHMFKVQTWDHTEWRNMTKL